MVHHFDQSRLSLGSDQEAVEGEAVSAEYWIVAGRVHCYSLQVMFIQYHMNSYYGQYYRHSHKFMYHLLSYHNMILIWPTANWKY